MLMIHERKCENNDIIPSRISPESHIHWKNHFPKIPLYFRKYAVFEAHDEMDNPIVINKTTKIYRQNPKLDGYDIISELNVLQSGYYESALGHDKDD